MNSILPFSLILVLIFSFFSCKKEQNYPPIISNQTFEISENSPSGSIIGNVVATDPDGDKLTYEILSEESLPVVIDSHTGILTVKTDGKIDYEEQSKLVFMVKVTDWDPKALYNMATITIDIQDIVEIPMEGIVAYYPFNSNAIDESVNSFDGIVFGPVMTSDRKGNANSAYTFDGSKDYINLSSLVGNGVRSIALWFRLDTNIDGNLNQSVTLFAREGDYNNYSEFSLAFVPSGMGWDGIAGKLRFFYSVNKSYYFYVASNSTTWQKERWYHVVAIIHPAEGMKMYIDNVLQSDIEPNYYAATANSSLNTYLGSWGTEPDRYFKGIMDDVIFYNRALTGSEVDNLFHQ